MDKNIGVKDAASMFICCPTFLAVRGSRSPTPCRGTMGTCLTWQRRWNDVYVSLRTDHEAHQYGGNGRCSYKRWRQQWGQALCTKIAETAQPGLVAHDPHKRFVHDLACTTKSFIMSVIAGGRAALAICRHGSPLSVKACTGILISDVFFFWFFLQFYLFSKREWEATWLGLAPLPMLR